MRYLIAALFLATALQADEVHQLDTRILRAQHRVKTYDNGVCIGIGTGIAIDKRRLITAKHVATSNGNTVWVDIHDEDGDYTGCSILAHVVRVDKESDLALLETNTDLDAWNKPEWGELKLGEWGCIVGCEWGFSPYACSWGQFAARHNQAHRELSQIQCIGVEGFSGGGCYSAKGKLVGIVVMGIQGCGALYVPAATVRAFVEAK